MCCDSRLATPALKCRSWERQISPKASWAQVKASCDKTCFLTVRSCGSCAEDEEMKDNSAPASGAGNSTHASGSGSGGSNAAAGSSQPRAGAGGVSSASSASTPAPAPASSAGGSLFANIDLSALGSGGRGGAGSGGGSSGGSGATVAPPVNNRGGAAMRGAGTPNPHTASTATADPAAIAVLMGMGFSREKCLAALAMANGDVSLAAGLLPDL